jgi:hypothetical protein
VKIRARPPVIPLSAPTATVPLRAPREISGPLPVLSPAPSEGAAPIGDLGWKAQSAGDYWLDRAMLKPPPASNLALDDVRDGPLPIGVQLPEILPGDDRHAVYQKLGALPLERMLTSPGYRYYRRPSAFPEVLQQVRSGNRVDTRPSIIDVRTDGHGHVRSVDLDSHHLRLAAFLETGKKFLRDIPFDQLLIKIDGQQREDTLWPKKVHGYAVPPEILSRAPVQVVDGDDPATVAIENLSNWDLGSRTSLARFHDTLLHRAPPKIAVLFGDSVERALQFKRERGLDEVVLAPAEVTPALQREVAKTDGVNLYLDQPASLRETFPALDWPTLVKYRLNLIYGTPLDEIATVAQGAMPSSRNG